MDFEKNFKIHCINNTFLYNYTNDKKIPDLLDKKVNNNFVKNSSKEKLEYSLFWCFYKIINGEFNFVLNKGFKEEINTKIGFVEDLREKKAELKQNKIKVISLETDIINNKDIDINSLHALCILYKKNILYLCDNCFFNMIQNDDGDDEIYLIKKKDKGYEFKENIGLDRVKYFKNNYYEIQNLNKPIKAINNYSKEELTIFAKKLNFEVNTKSNKQELYEKIKMQCMKFK